MWKILKYKSHELNLLKEDLKKKLDGDFQIYIPTIFLKKRNKRNKILERKINIMGDYLFCFHRNFSNQNLKPILSNLKGIKAVLEGCTDSQKDIINFIERCKNKEDSNGYLCQNFYELDLDKTYKFLSGPFNNLIFKILETQKNKIKIVLGNMKINLKNKNLIYQPI